MRRAVCALATVASFALACVARDAPPAPSVAITSAPQVKEARALRVLVAGDTIPHRPRLVDPARISAALSPLRALFDAADATIVNYEAATGEPEDLAPSSAHIALAASPSWMSALASSGVTAITAANNHACDLGEPGLDATLETAQGLGLTAIGADPRDPWRARVVADDGAHRVCAVAWSTFVNEPIAGCVASGKIAVAGFHKRALARIARAIARARDEAKCDAVIAILHGGDEYVAQTKGPLVQARRAAEAGADAVVIHHPHVPSPLDVVTTRDGRRVPVFASVGNLLSNQGDSWKPAYLPVRADRRVVSLNAWTRLGVIADLRFRWPDGGARPEVDWRYHLVWIDNEHATHRDEKLPRITARLLDPQRDAPIEAKLATDDGGPLALFHDPAWIERPTSERTPPL